MTERGAGSGGTEDNVRDEFEEATKGGRREDRREEDATRKDVEREGETGGTGGVKDNVQDEWDESQRH